MSDYILLGHIAKAFGIKGGLSLRLLNDKSQSITTGKTVMIKQKNSPLQFFTVSQVMDQHRIFFKEITDRDQAENLRSAEVYMKRTDLPEVDDDEYYFADLLGSSIVDIDGNVIGELVAFSTNNAQILFEIKTTDNKNASIPSIKPIVQKIDLENKIITVDLPEGLLNLEDK